MFVAVRGIWYLGEGQAMQIMLVTRRRIVSFRRTQRQQVFAPGKNAELRFLKDLQVQLQSIVNHSLPREVGLHILVAILPERFSQVPI